MRLVSPRTLLMTLALLLLPVMVLCASAGASWISPLLMGDSLCHWVSVCIAGVEASVPQDSLILSALRIPRMLLAGLVGSCLACGGVAMQGLFRNPLADPSLIGVTSGASAGASCVIVFAGSGLSALGFWNLSLVALGAFAGGALACLAVYWLATAQRHTSVSTMLLAGIAITALAAALNNLFSFIADNDMLRRISLWQMGSLDLATWPRVAMALAAALLCWLWLPRESGALNALLLGESEARHLGIDVNALKRRVILLTALVVGISVAMAGTIAFVGLVVPHMVRMLIGPDHRYLIPGAAMAGALLLMVADTLSHTLVAPAELPVGILTALLGVPFFFSLLHRQSRDRAIRL